MRVWGVFGFVVIGLFTGLAFGDQGWRANDLSILLPLPASVYEAGDLISPSDFGAKGQLIPFKPSFRVPRLTPDLTMQQSYNALRAVAFRMDPCFPRYADGSGCKRQIRIVWQPLIPMGGTVGGIETVDASVHTFYDLDDTEFLTLLAELKQSKARYGVETSNLPLMVHPAAEQQGLKGAFVRDLYRIVLSHAGFANLTRLTFMAVRGDSTFWTFGGVDFVQRNLVHMHIPRIQNTEAFPHADLLQAFFNFSKTRDNFVGSEMRAEPINGVDTYTPLTRNSDDLRPVEDRAAIEAGLQAIARIENPKYHSSATVDCVSCHLAESTRAYVSNRFYSGGTSVGASAYTFTSPYRLDNVSPAAHLTSNLHAFGYFEQQPSISQRVINEAAYVAEMLNQ